MKSPIKLILNLLGICFIISASGTSYSASPRDLYKLLEKDPLKAKEMLLLNQSEFGNNPRDNALEIAQVLIERKEWGGTAEMYELWGRLFRRNFPEYGDYVIWIEYLKACNNIYDSQSRHLKNWNRYYAKAKPYIIRKNKVKIAAIGFIESRLKGKGLDVKPENVGKLGGVWLRLATLVDYADDRVMEVNRQQGETSVRQSTTSPPLERDDVLPLGEGTESDEPFVSEDPPEDVKRSDDRNQTEAAPTTTRDSQTNFLNSQRERLDSAAGAYGGMRFSEAWEIYREVFPGIVSERLMELAWEGEIFTLTESLPQREKTIIEMLALFMKILHSNNRHYGYISSAMEERCKALSCNSRFFANDASRMEKWADYYYLMGLRSRKFATERDAVLDLLSALNFYLCLDVQSPRDKKRVNRKIGSASDVIREHWFNLDSGAKIGISKTFWRSPAYGKRERVVSHMETYDVVFEIVRQRPRMIKENLFLRGNRDTLVSRSAYPIENRVAAFKDTIRYIINENYLKLPDIYYLKEKFPWRGQWTPGAPNENLRNIRKDINDHIGKNKLHLLYDLYLALAELRKKQNRKHDLFENLMIAYMAAKHYPKNAAARKLEIKVRLRGIKRYEESGDFTLWDEEREKLYRAGLFDWWKKGINRNVSWKRPPKFENIKIRANKLESCEILPPSDGKRESIDRLFRQILQDLEWMANRADSDFTEATRYYKTHYHRLRDCLPMDRADYFKSRFARYFH